MKNQILYALNIFLLCLITIGKLNSQGNVQVTEGGYFDILTDSYGTRFNLADLNTASMRPLGSGNNSVNSLPTLSCQAGDFILYYAPGSYLAGSVAARSVVCQVFTDLSGFINAPLPLSSPTGSVKIHIYCDDLTSGGLAKASSFYLFPLNAANANQGIIYSQVEKGLISGLDPFTNFPAAVFPGSSNFYSGYLDVSPSVSWNTAMNTLSISSGQQDLYSAVLHEALHLVGFISLIDVNGFSKLGSSNNYFSRYDKFLKDASGAPLLTSQTPTSCGNSNIVYTPTSTAILGATSGTVLDITTCGSAVQYISPTNSLTVYTPTCYSSLSSFSHFEDICSGNYTGTCTSSPGNNNLYFVMSNSVGTGSCFVKRFPKIEERNVLCDLGYSVSSSYTSAANVDPNSSTVTIHSYGSACSPTMTIYAQNDGLTNSIYTFTTTTTSTNVPYNTILGNDFPASGLTVSCVELIYNNATFTLGASSLSVTASVGAGLVILKYLPVNSAGQFGNPAYIFLYFLLPGCTPTSVCNLVENSGFESQPSGNCGSINTSYVPQNIISCWRQYNGFSNIFVAGCTTNTIFNLGVNTLTITPPVSSYNGTVVNTRVFGLWYYPYNNYYEAIQNQLASPIVPSQTYQVSFWVYNRAATSTNTLVNPNNQPCVITLASYPTYPILTPTLNFPSGLNSLASFTINAGTAWTQVTSTFVASSTLTSNQNDLIVGIDYTKTGLIASPTGSSYIYCFIDDISITSLPTPTFSIPGITNCGNTSYTNLAQYASAVSGTFSGTGVTYSTGVYYFNSPATLTPGNYPIAFTYSTINGCTVTLWQNAIVSPAYSLTVSSSPYCSNTSSPAICNVTCNTFTGTAVYFWQPGYLTGPTQNFTNTSTVYTVTGQLGSCLTSQTLTIGTSTACCSSTLTPFAGSILATSMPGPLVINNDILVPPGAFGMFSGGEYLLAPNVKITVSGNAQFEIRKSHLYSCNTEMWKGVEVQDGGYVYMHRESGIDNLVEDAITAISMASQPTSTLGSILDISNTTFNKNYIDISLGAYQRTVSSYPFNIHNCVFTCRNLPFSSTQWPSTFAASTTNSTNAELRTVINATTGLNRPYLVQSGFSVANLKNPYSSEPSHTAIKISSVGITNGNYFYGMNVGNTGTLAADFNLFDSHGEFISAVNSNVTLLNNVFQNTQRYLAANITTATTTYSIFGGNAINDICNISGMNSKLDLTATNTSIGNRFWDCHTSVNGKNIYRFNIENGLFRSTQSTGSLPSGTFVPQGNTGITLNTNRFQYYMRHNEFTNINEGINIPIIAGPFYPASNCSVCVMVNGIYAANIAVLQNTFSPGTGSGNYLNKAVNITNVNGTSFTIAPNNTVTPFVIGSVISENIISNAFRGIYVDGMTGFKTVIEKNLINLAEDNTFYGGQHGIQLYNSTSTANQVAQSSILSNTLSAQSTTNTQVSLVDCNINTGLLSPSVCCNSLSVAYNGFVFNGANSQAVWAGNIMEPMARGFVLDQNAIIGQQGTGSTAANNIWNSAWTGTLNGTYCGPGSSATNSPMWVKAGSAYPPNPNGVNFLLQYGVANTISVSSGGDFNCAGIPNNFVVPLPNSSDYSNSEAYYIAETAIYRFLHLNDSVRNSNWTYTNHYNTLQSTNMGALMEVEQNLNDGDLANATTFNNSLVSPNTIESNYQQFYSIYIDYLNAGSYNADDSLNLFALTQLCPDDDGACVIQARALYNAIYNIDLIYPECGAAGGRMANLGNNGNGNASNIVWDVDMFPNPTAEGLTVVSKKRNEALKIEIRDINNRVVLFETLNTSDFFANLDLTLMNGVYFIKVENSDNESTIKKLVIAK